MQGKVNYTVVGIFVVVLTAFLITGIFWLSTIGDNKDYRTYLVYVHEDVTGLSVESPVRFNGVKVGYVKSIELDPTNSKLVTLKLHVEPGVAISTSTYAILNEQGVTGVVYVNLKSETENAPELKALPGQPYPIISSKPSLLMQLSAVLPDVATDVQGLSKSIAEVLNEKNRQSIQESLANIAVVTKTLADNSKNFTQTIEQLNKTLASIDKTAATITKTMQGGQTVMRNFSNQVLPNAQQAISNLSQATMSVHQLTDELQRNPSMLIRGKGPAQLGPGEK